VIKRLSPRYHESLGIFILERCGITPMQLLSSVAWIHLLGEEGGKRTRLKRDGIDSLSNFAWEGYVMVHVVAKSSP
jgi:hypothetical protein